MLAKLAKIALITSGTIATFATGMATGVVLVAVVVVKAAPHVERDKPLDEDACLVDSEEE